MNRLALIIREFNYQFSRENIIFILPLLAINGYTENNIITGGFVFLLFGYSLLQSALFENFRFYFYNLKAWLLLLTWGMYIVNISPNPIAGFKYYLIIIFVPFLLFQIIMNIKPSEGFFRTMLNVQFFSGLIIGLGSMAYALFYGFQDKTRLSSFWEGQNIVAGYLMIVFMFNISFIINRKNNEQLLFHIVTLVGIVAGLFLTQTRGVWLAILISIAIYVIKRPKVVIPFTIILVILFYLFASSLQNRIFTVVNFTKDASAVGRIQAWTSSIILIKRNPIIGYGFESYVELRDQVYSTYIVKVIHSHNTYLNSLVEMGLIGTILYFYFFLLAFRYSFSFKNQLFREKYKFFIDGLQLSFWGLVIIFNFEPYFSVYDNSTLVIWLLISLSFLFHKFSLTSEKI